MSVLSEIIITILITLGILTLIWIVRGKMVTPVKLDRDEKLLAVIRGKGEMPGLQQAVEGLLWLSRSGTLPMEIIIADIGMEYETAKVAKLLALNRGEVTILQKEALGAYIAEEPWTNPNRTQNSPEP